MSAYGELVYNRYTYGDNRTRAGIVCKRDEEAHRGRRHRPEKLEGKDARGIHDGRRLDEDGFVAMVMM